MKKKRLKSSAQARGSSGRLPWRVLVAVIAIVIATGWAGVRAVGNAAFSESNRKLATGDVDGAVRSGRAAVRCLPGDTDALCQLARCLGRQEDHAGALDALRRAHALDPESSDIFLAFCRESLFSKPDDATEKELAQYVDGHSTDANAMLLLGQMLERMKNAPQNQSAALYWEQDAYRLDPTNEEIASTVGARFVSENQPTQALQYYETALKEHPQSPLLLRGALLCYDELGQKAQAADIAGRLRALPTNLPESPPFRKRLSRFNTTGPSTVAARFVDVAAEAGIDHNFLMVESKPQNVLETIGAGCAFLDYDNDGNLDILLVDHVLNLYHGDGHGHFTDVTHVMGVDKLNGYFLGCAVGDFDNDGYDDIVLTGYNTVALLRNDHGKGFIDVTAGSGLKPNGWNTSAAWGDIDGDGKLDLYICRYAEFPPGDRGLCLMANRIIACGPYKFAPQRGDLYRNLGHGKFAAVTSTWAVDHTSGRGLGVAFGDVDGSGRQSLYMTNDLLPSNLYLNTGATFRDISRTSGTSVREDGKGFSGMGTDWGDYDNDGRLDVSAMAFSSEDKRILHNEGGGAFTQQYRALGMGSGTTEWVTFGTKWLDYDNDGWLDMVYSSGPTDDAIDNLQPTVLYHNERGTAFVDASAGLLGDARRPTEGRGLAIGDYDNDGLVDVLVVDSDGKPMLLHNETKEPGNWLDARLVGVKSNRDAYGAEVTVVAGGQRQVRVCHADGSYLSSSDKRVHIGMASVTKVDSLTVRWPSGQVDKLRNVRVNRVITIIEGTGVGR